MGDAVGKKERKERKSKWVNAVGGGVYWRRCYRCWVEDEVGGTWLDERVMGGGGGRRQRKSKDKRMNRKRQSLVGFLEEKGWDIYQV